MKMQVLTKLRALREGYPLTVQELAAKSGVTADTVRRLEGGDSEARPDTARRLADALGVEVRGLAGPQPLVGPRFVRKFVDYTNPEARKRSEKYQKRREREERKRQERLEEATKRAERDPVFGPLIEEERSKGEDDG